MHFVTGVAEERSEHFVRMLSKRRRSVIGIEGGFAQVNGPLNSLHGASTRVRQAIISRTRRTSLSQTSATVRMAPQGTPLSSRLFSHSSRERSLNIALIIGIKAS